MENDVFFKKFYDLMKKSFPSLFLIYSHSNDIKIDDKNVKKWINNKKTRLYHLRNG